MARKGVEKALEASLKAMALDTEHGAVVELCREYARKVDTDSDSLWRIGPRLLDALESLGMTPRARAAILKGEKPEEPESDPIDELRARREQRAAR